MAAISTAAGTDDMAAEQPKFPVQMRKSGFSEKEIEEIIVSKVQAIFEDSEINNYTKITKEVVSTVRVRETKGGTLDKRCKSTSGIQDAGALPASSSGDAPQSPRNMAAQQRGIVGDWNKTLHGEQKQLFEYLLDDRKIDRNDYYIEEGYLMFKRDNAKCNAVQVCDLLDEVTIEFAREEPTTEKRQKVWEIKELCKSITFHRFCTASAMAYDILKVTDNEEGYQKWRKHLWMFASFAALMVGLDIYLGKTLDSNQPLT